MSRIHKIKKYTFIFVFISVGMFSFLLKGFCDDNVTNDTREAGYTEMELFTDVMLHVKKYYVKEKTYKEIMTGALHGMLKALDPHSSFLDVDGYREIREETSGSFGGIGIHIGLKNGILTVIAPIEDTPAFKAGLQSGDRIIGINGKKTFGMTLQEAVKILRGQKGEKVSMSILRLHEDVPIEVEIIRDDIIVSQVKGTRIIQDKIGYIRITQFSSPTADAFQKSLDQLIGKNINALVLDLRSNPGGLLSSAVDISQKFLKKGDLIVTTKGRKGVSRKIERKASGVYHYTDFPMAILVNGGSASASEIVAGALKDHKRAVLIGTTTYGKGSVQSIMPLNPDGKRAIRLTTAYYYTPSGKLIHNIGIEPDIPVYISPKEWRDVQIRRAHIENPSLYTDDEKKPYEKVVDRQLQRAVDMLKAINIFK